MRDSAMHLHWSARSSIHCHLGGRDRLVRLLDEIEVGSHTLVRSGVSIGLNWSKLFGRRLRDVPHDRLKGLPIQSFPSQKPWKGMSMLLLGSGEDIHSFTHCIRCRLLFGVVSEQCQVFAERHLVKLEYRSRLGVPPQVERNL